MKFLEARLACRFGTAGINYQLLGQGAQHFSVDKKTGTITVAPCSTPGTTPCLDFEEQTEYFLTYKACNIYIFISVCSVIGKVAKFVVIDSLEIDRFLV